MPTLLPTTSAETQIFTFGDLTLRALLLEGEPWFVAADLAQALDYSDAWNLTRRLDQDEVQNLQIGGFGNRGVNLVNESGLYASILGSRKPEAKAFKKWVTAEVLPAIRKTGAYQTPKTFAQRALEFQQEAMEIISQQEQELEVTRPKALTYDRILTPDHTFGFLQLVGAVREHFPVNGNDLKRLLREQGLLYLSSLTATAKAIDGGWAVQRAQGKYGGKERFQVRFTTKTLEWLLEELAPLADAV